MNLIRWEPFSGMDEMFNRFPSLFARFPRYAGSGDGNYDWSPRSTSARPARSI